MLHHLASLPAPFLLLHCHGLIRSVSSARSLHLAGPCSSFLVQLACPSSVKPSLTHTPSHRVCRPMPAPALAWSCLRSGPGLIRPRTPALSGTQGMFTNRVLDSCLLGLRLDPNHEGRSSEPARSGRIQWLSSCSPSLKKS